MSDNKEKSVDAVWQKIEDQLAAASSLEVELVARFEAWVESRTAVHTMAKERPELHAAFMAASKEGQKQILELFTSKVKRSAATNTVVVTDEQLGKVEGFIKKNKGVGKAEVVTGVALSSEVVGAALAALKKAEKIQSSGQGRGAVWSAVKQAAVKAA